MTTSDWAFVISLCSFALALSSFIWNVWSKFIYPKAKLRVGLQATIIFHPGNPDHKRKFLTLNATNYGPGEITVHSAVLRRYKKGWWKDWRAFFNSHLRRQYGVLNPFENFPTRFDHTIGPFSGGLPKKLAIGESFSSYFPRQADWFQHEGVRIGFSDSFDRNHWCSKRHVRKVMEALQKDAAGNEPRADTACSTSRVE
jgi:hypothetical protein